MIAERAIGWSLLALAGVVTLAAFAAYRSPAMLFFLDGFRLCG